MSICTPPAVSCQRWSCQVPTAGDSSQHQSTECCGTAVDGIKKLPPPQRPIEHAQSEDTAEKKLYTHSSTAGYTNKLGHYVSDPGASLLAVVEIPSKVCAAVLIISWLLFACPQSPLLCALDGGAIRVARAPIYIAVPFASHHALGIALQGLGTQPPLLTCKGICCTAGLSKAVHVHPAPSAAMLSS